MFPHSNTDATVLGPPDADGTVDVTRAATGANVNFKDKHANENGAVFKIEGERSALFMGDVQDDTHHYAESWLIQEHDDPESDIDLAADVLFVGHHGSNNATSEEFLDRVDPELAVISSELNGQYNHPHDEVLETLHEQDVGVYWTAGHGTVRTDLDEALATEQTTDLATTHAADLAALKHYCQDQDVTPEAVETLAPGHLPEETPDWVGEAPMIADSPETMVEAAITNAESVEEVRQVLEDHPDAADHLRDVVHTDQDEHVTSYEEAMENKRRYQAALTEANREPTMREQFRSKLPTWLGGTDGTDQDLDPAEQIDGPLRPADRPGAAVTGMTAASQRELGMTPRDDLLAAEKTADRAVETAETAGELCWGLRDTPGAHKDFLAASNTPNAHSETSAALDQTTTAQATTDQHHDEDRGLSMGP